MIHYFNTRFDSEQINQEECTYSNDCTCTLPDKFTYPFNYSPHPLVTQASQAICSYLQGKTEWADELSHGKMFGVLLVQTDSKAVGYLAAFSGNLAGSNYHDYFVPPVFDLLRPGDFFKVEEKNISAINDRIAQLTSSESYHELQRALQEEKAKAENEITKAREALKEAKAKRDEERIIINNKLLTINNNKNICSSITSNDNQDTTIHNSDEEQSLITSQQLANRLAELIKESQFQKAELKRLEKRLKQEVTEKEQQVHEIEAEITRLKDERKTRSAALQMKLFEHFRMLNAKGEAKDLCQIFNEYRQSIPPAGAGECALPKMLQYAYLHKLRPLAFGEFWWGESPKDEIRQHGQFYPSCKGKCEPILKHMLIGLEVEENPLAKDFHPTYKINILYEDEWIIAIEKPADVLSTPGKEAVQSISEQLHQLYPEATGPILVHRLDMATSGILLGAKDKETHALLQAQFEARKVRKIYTAILDGIPAKEKGCINLPLCPNPNDRPRQMVSYEYGKEAITYYKVIATKGNNALVEFNLQTGRTHQIRMHAAHPLGLNCPIKGDNLYGTKSNRLYLHATEVEFTHPTTGKRIVITSPAPFTL